MTAKTSAPAAPKYAYNVSKETEIAALREYRAQFENGTYTAAFLSERAIEWFSGQAGNDFSCDIMNAIDFERNATVNAISNTAIAIREKNAAESDLAKVTARYESAKETIATATSEIERLGTRVDEYRERETENAIAFENAKYTAEREIAARDAEIIRLKAMIFDLEHAAK